MNGLNCKAALGLGLLLAMCSGASAQTNVSMLACWDDNNLFQSEDNVQYQPTGLTTGNHNRARLWWWNSEGRLRFDRSPGQRAVSSIGYRVLTMDFNTSDWGLLPNSLVDISLAWGGSWSLTDDWSLQGLIGGGVSTNGHFTVNSAWYGKAALAGRWQFDRRQALVFGLSYDRMRPLWPDVPLPWLGWEFELDNALSWTLGFPVCRFQWSASPSVHVQMQWQAPANAHARVDWWWWDQTLGGYARVASACDMFSISSLPSNQHGIWQMWQIETGLHLKLSDGFDAILGCGYSFDQRYRTGFDIRNTSVVSGIDNRPYLLLQVRSSF